MTVQHCKVYVYGFKQQGSLHYIQYKKVINANIVHIHVKLYFDLSLGPEGIKTRFKRNTREFKNTHINRILKE